MPTVNLVNENSTHPTVKAVFDDIKATRKVERITNFWRALANNPEQLESVWNKPDEGIWEIRGEPRHFTYSKVFCEPRVRFTRRRITR